MPGEMIDIVNEKNEVIGKRELKGIHSTSLWHRAVHVFVFNSAGKLFLQLRPKIKKLFPEVWDSSASEHVDSGESFEAAALRGLKEELNIDIEKISLVGEKKIPYKDEKVQNNEFVQSFECIFDGKIKINEHELEDGKFFSLDEVKRLSKEKKTTPFFSELLDFYLEKKSVQQTRPLPRVSVIVATYNNAPVLKRALEGMLALDYPKELFEIVVANDGSTDNTAEMMRKEFGAEKRIKFLNLPHVSVCRARNAAIAATAKESKIVVNMDHDCIPEKDWLKKIVAGFDSESTGVVSSYNYYGGTSTAFRKDLLERVRGYDEDYGYYREDTDLSFKIMDLGYAFRFVQAGFEHDHKIVKPKGIVALAKQVLQRLKNHENDVLLYKKHPTKICREFLNIKLGFLVDPPSDFRAATGTWHKGGKLQTSSPRGIVFLENKTPFHTLLIIILGISYVIAVKAVRLIGSIKFGKLLV